MYVTDMLICLLHFNVKPHINSTEFSNNFSVNESQMRQSMDAVATVTYIFLRNCSLNVSHLELT